MKKHYWLFAGAFVGVFSFIMSYANLSLIVDNNENFNLLGIIAVIAEYTFLIYLLNLGQKFVEKDKKS